MSKELAQTVGGKKVAWLLAILAALAVFATVASNKNDAKASAMTDPTTTSVLVSDNISPSSVTSSDHRTSDGLLPQFSVHHVASIVTTPVSTASGFVIGQLVGYEQHVVDLLATFAIVLGVALLVLIVSIGMLTGVVTPDSIKSDPSIRSSHRSLPPYSRKPGISERAGLRRRAIHIAMSLALHTTGPNANQGQHSADLDKKWFQRATRTTGTVAHSIDRLAAWSYRPMATIPAFGRLLSTHPTTRDCTATTNGSSQPRPGPYYDSPTPRFGSEVIHLSPMPT